MEGEPARRVGVREDHGGVGPPDTPLLLWSVIAQERLVGGRPDRGEGERGGERMTTYSTKAFNRHHIGW